MIEMSEDMVAFSKHLTEYYSQLADTWGEAQKKVNQKMSDVPQDAEHIEALKRVWIDMFDNDFTELFDSPKFGSNYGKLVSKELEIVKHWNNISNTVLQSANLPSKEEIDDVYREIHSLKKRLRLSELEMQRLRRTGSSAASRGASGPAPATDVGGAPPDPERADTLAEPVAVAVVGDGDKPQPRRADHSGDVPRGASSRQRQQPQPRPPQDTQEQPQRQQPQPRPRNEQRRPNPPQPSQHRPQHQQSQQPHGVQAQPPHQAPQPPAPSRPRDTAPPGGPVERPAHREPENRLPPSKPDPVSLPSAPRPPDRPDGPSSAQNTKNPRRRRRRPRRRLSKSGRPGSPNMPPTQPEPAPKPAPAPGSPKDAHTTAVTRHAPGASAGPPETIPRKKRRRRHRPDKHTRRMQQQQQGQSRTPQPQPTSDTRPAPSPKPQGMQNPKNTHDSKRQERDTDGDSAQQAPHSGKSGTAADRGLPRKDGDAGT